MGQPEHHLIPDTELNLELWLGRRIASNVMDVTLNACVDTAMDALRIYGGRRVVRDFVCESGFGGFIQMETAMLPGLRRAEPLSYMTVFLVIKELEEILIRRRRIHQSVWFRVIDSTHGLMAVGSLDEGTARGGGHTSRSSAPVPST